MVKGHRRGAGSTPLKGRNRSKDGSKEGDGEGKMREMDENEI